MASDTQISLPLIADIVEKKVIWCDIALKRFPLWNNVENNLSGVSPMLRAMARLVKPNLFDLFALHAQARGEIVNQESAAQTVFSVEHGLTPFEGDKISALWL